MDESNELLGLLCAYNKRDEHGKPYKDRGFSKEFDEPLMKILTTKLIISMKNAQLVNELERFKLLYNIDLSDTKKIKKMHDVILTTEGQTIDEVLKNLLEIIKEKNLKKS